MFKSSNTRQAESQTSVLSFSSPALSSPNSYSHLPVADLGLPAEITSLAFDPVQSLLAVGTLVGSIHVWGHPSVVARWVTSGAAAGGSGPLSFFGGGNASSGAGGGSTGYREKVGKIKFLAFWSGRGMLIAVDARDTLSIWDLSEINDKTGQPHRHAIHSVRSVVTSIELSSTHSHLFLGLKDGTVDCYDIERGCVSPYKIVNLWLQHEEMLRRSGVPDAPSRRHIPICTDVKQHPRDINLLLIAYEGGIGLWDIKAQSLVRTYELVILPGAPGGGTTSDELTFSERRPGVTCLAWRADGLMFAAGHEDGCISFWATEDGDKPIMVRTLDKTDVNIVTAEGFFGSDDSGEDQPRAQPVVREPIFRLAWSSFPDESYFSQLSNAWSGTGDGNPVGPSGSNQTDSVTSPELLASPASQNVAPATGEARGKSVLTVLGGLLSTAAPGVHTLHFPVFDPSSGSTQASVSPSSAISPALRQAMKNSVTTVGQSLYLTPTPPEDFILLPRNNPHFGMAYDPTSIIISFTPDSRLPLLPPPMPSRGMKAFSFPPSLSRPPDEKWLPGQMYFVGPEAVTGTEIWSLSSPSHKKLVGAPSRLSDGDIGLNGGRAHPSIGNTDRHAPSSSFDRRKIMTTSHLDLSVRFWDISPQLLAVPDTPALKGAGENDPLAARLKHEFPQLLHHSTIPVGHHLVHESLTQFECHHLAKHAPGELSVRWMKVATESLETAIALNTGEVIIYRFGLSKAHPTSESQGGLNVPPPEELFPEETPLETHNELNDTMSQAIAELTNSDPEPVPSSPHYPPSHLQGASPEPARSSLSRDESVRKPPRPPRSRKRGTPNATPRQSMDHSSYEVAHLNHLADWSTEGWKPLCLMTARRGDVTAIALCDCGFVAVAWGSFVMVVDLRGLDIIMSCDVGEPAAHGKKKGERSPVRSMTWTIAPLGDEPEILPRLIVATAQGSVHAFSLAHSLDTWILRSGSASVSQSNLADPLFMAILNSRGTPLTAQQDALGSAMRAEMTSHGDGKDAGLHSMMVVVTRKGIVVRYNIVGPQVAKIDTEDLRSGTLLRRQGMVVLALVTVTGNLTFFTLPNLEPVCKFPLKGLETAYLSFSEDGDYSAYNDPTDISLHSVFHFNRGRYPPLVNLHEPTRTIPSQATTIAAVTSALASWFGAQGPVVSGDELDSTLAGPKRPPPRNRPKKIPPAPPAPAQPQASGSGLSRTQSTAQKASPGASAYSQLVSNLDERQEKLTGLQDTMDELTDAASSWASEVKKVAISQTAKRGFMGLF